MCVFPIEMIRVDTNLQLIDPYRSGHTLLAIRIIGRRQRKVYPALAWSQVAVTHLGQVGKVRPCLDADSCRRVRVVQRHVEIDRYVLSLGQPCNETQNRYAQ